MATDHKRTDDKLKARGTASTKKAKKDAGPKYQQSSLAATPSVAKANGFGRKS